MISQYVASPLDRAQYRLVDPGTFAATVRGLKGVVATGATLEACRRELTEVVEEWVLIRVTRGLESAC
jgi:predicted RNase H-like HicB family nuclease